LIFWRAAFASSIDQTSQSRKVLRRYLCRRAGVSQVRLASAIAPVSSARRYQSHPLSASQKKRNKKYGAVRAKVEHVFRVIKCQFGYRKVRYHGLAKNEAQMFSLTALANLYLIRRCLREESA